jgi:hypothetical protein
MKASNKLEIGEYWGEEEKDLVEYLLCLKNNTQSNNRNYFFN